MKALWVSLFASAIAIPLFAATSLSEKELGMSPVIVINPIEVPSGREAEALAIWDQYAAYFRQQPGYIGTRLHRSLDPRAKFLYINVAEWRSAEDFMKALNSDEIKKVGSGFPPDMPHYPSLYQVIRE